MQLGVKSTIAQPVTIFAVLCTKVTAGEGRTLYRVAAAAIATVDRAVHPVSIELDTGGLRAVGGSRLLIGVVDERPRLLCAPPQGKGWRRVDLHALVGDLDLMWCDRLDLERHLRAATCGEGVDTLAGRSMWPAKLHRCCLRMEPRVEGEAAAFAVSSAHTAVGGTAPATQAHGADIQPGQKMFVTVETSDERRRGTPRGRPSIGSMGLVGPASPSGVSASRSAVLFRYLYYHDTRWKEEATHGWGCPFCGLSCGSYDGLQCHLMASHDLFSYHFGRRHGDGRPTEVKVRCRQDAHDALGQLRCMDGKACRDASERSFAYRSGSGAHRLRAQMDRETSRLVQVAAARERRALKTPLERDRDGTEDGKAKRKGAGGERQSQGPSKRTRDNGGGGVGAASERVPERVRSRRPAPVPISKRVFYHARTCQPMGRDEVHGEDALDSDDDVDVTMVHAEDLAMLGEYANLDGAQVEFMHAWNLFTTQHKILADSYVPRACEIFGERHRKQLAKPELRRCFMLHMLNLAEFGLVDAADISRALGIEHGSGGGDAGAGRSGDVKAS